MTPTAANNRKDSPTPDAATRPGRPLVYWSVAAVICCPVLGGLIGAGIGVALGSFVPGYYRSVFSDGYEARFDPVAVGLGQGLTQGIVIGAVFGFGLLAIFFGSYWRFWVSAISCAVALFGVPAAFILGAVIGQVSLYHNFAMHQQQRIEAFLEEHPERFGDLSVHKDSSGSAFASGTVQTQQDYDLLKRRLHEMFGDELAEEMIDSVDLQGR